MKRSDRGNVILLPLASIAFSRNQDPKRTYAHVCVVWLFRKDQVASTAGLPIVSIGNGAHKASITGLPHEAVLAFPSTAANASVRNRPAPFVELTAAIAAGPATPN